MDNFRNGIEKICGLKQLVNFFVNVIYVLPSVCERNAYEEPNREVSAIDKLL